MKVLVKETSGEGLEGLLGQKITVWCANYIYAGELVGVNEHDIKLSDAQIVYETGALGKKGFSDAQKLPADWYIRLSAIESYGEMS